MQQTKFYNKLNKNAAKRAVKAAKARGVMFFGYPELGVTVALVREGPKMVKFGLAIASPDEVKFRKLVGKHLALKRLDFDSQPAVIPKGMEEEFAFQLAELVGY